MTLTPTTRCFRARTLESGGIASRAFVPAASLSPSKAGWKNLYSRVSDKQTIGSVVGELRLSLGELEKALDSFL